MRGLLNANKVKIFVLEINNIHRDLIPVSVRAAT